MVVDDEPEVRKLLERVLSGAGHQVLQAADAAEAWRLLDREPAAMFVDIDMPGETGVEFVLRLRDSKEGLRVPVTFVTAFRERAMPLVSSGTPGIVDVIDKPFRFERVLSALDRMLAA